MVDKQIVDKKYPTDNDEKEYVSSQTEQFRYYYETYYKAQYDNFDAFLFYQYGVKDEAELKEVLALNYKRNKATDDYAKTLIKDDEIKEYYEKEIFGDMRASHILIKAKYESNASQEEITKAKEEAKKKAEDIIAELNKADKDKVAEKFAELAKEKSEDSSSSNGGDLDWFKAGVMDKAFEKATRELSVNSYTKEPVESTFGYHIILKTGQKDKDSLENVKETIIDALVDKKEQEDSKIQMKALVQLRKDNGMEIQDKELKKLYKNYVENSKKEDEEE